MMKTLATGIAAAIVLGAMSSSPALAGDSSHTTELGSRGPCPINAISCPRSNRPTHPRCYVVVDRRNGNVVKRRVCTN